MREHEVPTHVQAEDKVLLWFTFPQIVAVVAVCAVSYGVFRYFPFGPSELRLVIAVALGIVGVVAVVGKGWEGGGCPWWPPTCSSSTWGPGATPGPSWNWPGPRLPRRCRPSPAPCDCWQERWGEGSAAGSGRPVRGGDGAPSGPMAGSASVATADTADRGKAPREKDTGHRKPWRFSLALSVITLSALAIPAAALADGPWSDDAWRLEEVRALPPDPVPGRRLFLEGLTVIDRTAWVTIRAATDLRLDARSYGGDDGRVLNFFVADHMQQGEAEIFGLSLDGPDPSYTFAWRDGLGQTGALALKGRQLPHPLPSVEGEVCSLRVTTLGWTPGEIRGVVNSGCAAELEERVDLAVASGHHRQSVTAMLPSMVTGVAGTVSVSAGGSVVSVPFVSNGETHFRLPVPGGEAVHGLDIETALSASLSVPRPPLVQLIHHPQWTESRTETVSLLRPGTSRYVSRTLSVALPPDGRVVQYNIGATLSVPSETVRKDVTLEIVHQEHVRAEVVQRDPVARTRSEALTLAASVAADPPFQALSLPEPTPTPEPAQHQPANDDEARDLFDRPGWWEWP